MKKLIRVMLAAVCLSSLVGCSSSDDIDVFCTLYGFVIEKSTNEPVPNASITLSPDGKTTVTDTDGKFQFDNLKEISSEYIILVQKEGYKSERKSVKAVSGSSVRVDIHLQKHE